MASAPAAGSGGEVAEEMGEEGVEDDEDPSPNDEEGGARKVFTVVSSSTLHPNPTVALSTDFVINKESSKGVLMRGTCDGASAGFVRA
jgi:hypothetical protein